MENKILNICIGMDDNHHYEVIAETIEQGTSGNPAISYQIKNLKRHDWIEAVEPFDMVIWWPTFLGPHPTSLFKQKIYFLENYLGKLVVPNYSTIWPYESKIAQSFLFQMAGVRTPNTVVSFDYHDAVEQVDQLGLPLVIKKSYGSASNNVRLIKSKQQAQRALETVFYQSLWRETKQNKKSIKDFFPAVFHRWFWKKTWLKINDDLSMGRRYGDIYMQEFIPGNTADLRITVIGDRFAYGFWRNNRPGDFRASGSGRIDFERPIPEEVMCYCLEISKKFGFDSMAYDVLFKDQTFLITEMSFSYVPKYLFEANGYYEMRSSGELAFHPGHTWPQELWAKWALIRAGFQN